MPRRRSNTSNIQSFSGVDNGKTKKTDKRRTNMEGTSRQNSAPLPPFRSLSSKMSDLSSNCLSFNFSDWSSEYHIRQRSPQSKNILMEIKEKLLEEIKYVEKEIHLIEAEKRTLLNVRNFVVNFRQLLDESERNNQGVLVVSKLKNIIDKTVSDIQEYDEAIRRAASIPFSDELCNSLQEVRDILTSLNGLRLKMEHVDDVFSRCGRLFGIVDTILLMFYDHDNSSPFPEDEGILKTDPNLYEKYLGYAEGDALQENMQHTSPSVQKTLLEEVGKQVQKIMDQLKSVDRMTSGRPKMKCLVSKFHEVDKDLNIKGLKTVKNYSLVLGENLRMARSVLRLEKPGQNELDEIRFLLSQLAGRTSLLYVLEESEDTC